MIQKGEIYLIDFNNQIGSEQAGIRPAVIVQNKAGNNRSPTTIVCPLTSKVKTNVATHVELTPDDCGILRPSTVLCEQIRVIDKTRIKRKLGDIINKQKIQDINNKLMISIGVKI